jgi:hypothetical protein
MVLNARLHDQQLAELLERHTGLHPLYTLCKMDEHPQNKEHIAVIESWMLTVLRDGGITRYDDLHLDRIDAKWKSVPFWIPAALESLDLALWLRTRFKLKLTVAVGFSLQSSERHQGVDFSTREEFELLFNRTPPSLYLFKSQEEPWRCPSKGLMIEKINPAILDAENKDCWYMEFQQGDEYYRSVFIAEGTDAGVQQSLDYFRPQASMKLASARARADASKPSCILCCFLLAGKTSGGYDLCLWISGGWCICLPHAA